MNNLSEIREKLSTGKMDERLARLYGSDIIKARNRFLHLADLFEAKFTDGEDVRFFSAPGRTEVCGNHTDHNHGKVLAAAIDLDAVACAVKTDDHFIRVYSENYPGDVIDLNDLRPQAKETGKSASLVRGVAARFVELGYNVGGIDAVTVNSVLKGSGMSSSAAFEVLIGTIFNELFMTEKVTAIDELFEATKEYPLGFSNSVLCGDVLVALVSPIAYKNIVPTSTISENSNYVLVEYKLK